VSDPQVLIVDPALAGLAGRLARFAPIVLSGDVGDLGHRARSVRAIVTLGSAVLDTALVEALPGLGLIACLASGYEGVDVRHALGRGIQVTHSASVNADDVADHAVGMLICAVRGIAAADRWVRAGRWGAERFPPRRPLGGLNVGIAGLGTIGEAVARRLEPFASPVGWWSRRERPGSPWRRFPTLLDLAAWSDVLVVSVRADRTNAGLVDAGVLQALGEGGILVNVSRGSVVDEAELIAALRRGTLAGAALDVFEQEPLDLGRWSDVPNVLLSPHIAGTTTRSPGQLVDLLVENVELFMEGLPVKTPVPTP